MVYSLDLENADLYQNHQAGPLLNDLNQRLLKGEIVIKSYTGEFKSFPASSTLNLTQSLDESLDQLSRRINRFIRTVKVIDANNYEDLVLYLKNLEDKKKLAVMTYIPNKKDYEEKYSKKGVLEFFDRNQRKDLDACLKDFEDLYNETASPLVEFFVIRDEKIAEKLAMSDFHIGMMLSMGQNNPFAYKYSNFKFEGHEFAYNRVNGVRLGDRSMGFKEKENILKDFLLGPVAEITQEDDYKNFTEVREPKLKDCN